jgi:hypothetical protein
MKPTSNSHPPFSRKDLGVFVKVEDLTLLSSETPFLEENILKIKALGEGACSFYGGANYMDF